MKTHKNTENIARIQIKKFAKNSAKNSQKITKARQNVQKFAKIQIQKSQETRLKILTHLQNFAKTHKNSQNIAKIQIQKISQKKSQKSKK